MLWKQATDKAELEEKNRLFVEHIKIAHQKACDLELKNRKLEYQLEKEREQRPEQPADTQLKASSTYRSCYVSPVIDRTLRYSDNQFSGWPLMTFWVCDRLGEHDTAFNGARKIREGSFSCGDWYHTTGCVGGKQCIAVLEPARKGPVGDRANLLQSFSKSDWPMHTE